MKKIYFSAFALIIISSLGIISGQVDSTAKSTPPPESINYFFPDIRQNALIVDGKRLWFKPIIAIVMDYDAFWQDDLSLQQVGIQAMEAWCLLRQLQP